eukprot:13530603-Alexandrium_andersonii.AAC.1
MRGNDAKRQIWARTPSDAAALAAAGWPTSAHFGHVRRAAKDPVLGVVWGPVRRAAKGPELSGDRDAR